MYSVRFGAAKKSNNFTTQPNYLTKKGDNCRISLFDADHYIKMFSRFVVRSTRFVKTAQSNGSQVAVASYSTGAKKTTPPPPQQNKTAAAAAAPAAAAPKVTEEFDSQLESLDWDADLTAEEIKSFHEERQGAKKNYKQAMEQLFQNADKTSTISSPKFEVKPALIITTPAGKIAHALFSTASQARSLGIVQKDVELLLTSFSTIPSFKSIIESDVDASEKQTLLDLFSSAIKVTPISEFFLYYMTNEKLFNLIVPALKDFIRLYNSLSSEMIIRLTVAHNYNEKEKQTLQQQVAAYFSPDSTLKFIYTVDESIKGGYKIESPFLNHDASLFAATDKAQKEERVVMSGFFNELKGAVTSDKAVWESKEFQEKYLSFDAKAYEESIEKN
ncbi:mitochondrial F1 complex ATP synthase [Cavenderia fasciculata]|uniref:Mitochondrial F1 complex ATP synthase n=1 Tax=Cavenderia fasciculata TaxID=261658 RepID=F4PLE8_CACFS|nr:mitochondrial F1 complex ATP synthase [Cavenderia fasciculata]EGG23370.1 mitochondrial F1 complex ATP synthase [Cavenderia fasciculata]|eukprot:XP_004361221.1 mitochondrial F1 complex ATP synthase [Cavenderia fasciculata]